MLLFSSSLSALYCIAGNFSMVQIFHRSPLDHENRNRWRKWWCHCRNMILGLCSTWHNQRETSSDQLTPLLMSEDHCKQANMWSTWGRNHAYTVSGVPRGVLRVLEHPHQSQAGVRNYHCSMIKSQAREEATHTATDLQLANNSYTHSSLDR